MRALPPSYELHISSVNGAERAPHKNVVTEAGDVRARDEVRLDVSTCATHLTSSVI